MRVVYESLADSHILMQRYWDDKLADVAQMEVGHDFWQVLHRVVSEANYDFEHGSMKDSSFELGRTIKGFKPMVMNSAIYIYPQFDIAV